MTKFLGLCTGALALVLATQASAQVVTLTTTMNGGEETPVLNTGMAGTAEVSVDVANREVAVTLSIFNTPTPTTAGHIHIGSSGISGPVILNFPTNLNGRTGDFAMTFRLAERDFVARPAQGINTIDDAIQAIVLGNAYVNIHTTQNPGGEIRGQLKR
jgi:CHRD domain